MKTICIIVFSLFIGSEIYGQKPKWIPFEWVGKSVPGKYFDILAINIPVSIDGLPHKFNMQFDLGAATTVIYGNSIDKYPELTKKIDSRWHIGNSRIFVSA